MDDPRQTVRYYCQAVALDRLRAHTKRRYKELNQRGRGCLHVATTHDRDGHWCYNHDTPQKRRLGKVRLRRVTQCRRGHPWTPENTITETNGRRHCRTCRDAYLARRLGQRPKRRGTDRCYKGHLRTPENTYVNNGRRWCRICRQEYHQWIEPRPEPDILGCSECGRGFADERSRKAHRVGERCLTDTELAFYPMVRTRGRRLWEIRRCTKCNRRALPWTQETHRLCAQHSRMRRRRPR